MERKKQQKRNSIIDSAEELIAKKGYWEMTIDEVAADSDVAKGTVYLYFNSKESLCAAVVARILVDMNAAILEKLEGVHGGSDRIQVFGNAVIQWTLQNPGKAKVLDNAISLNFKDINDENVHEMVMRDNDQIQIMTDNYCKAVEEGSIRPDVAPLPTAIFMRMAIWVALNPFPSHMLLMSSNDIQHDMFLRNARDLLLYATHKDAKKWIAHEVPAVTGKARKRPGK